MAARARDLGIEEVSLGVRDKVAAYDRILRRLGLRDREVCYLGDDIMDLPVLRRAGLAVAPADAHPEVRRRVPFITRAAGGRGAVRETIDALLRAQGRWEAAMRTFAGSEP